VEQKTGQAAAISAVDSSPSSRNNLVMFIPTGVFLTFACRTHTDSVLCERATAQRHDCTGNPTAKEAFALLCIITLHYKSPQRDSHVNKSTTAESEAVQWAGYGTDSPGIEPRIIRTGSGGHPESSSKGTRAPSPEGKRPGQEADHLSPTSVEVKNEWIYTATLTIRTDGLYLLVGKITTGLKLLNKRGII
jgi:hypothetical protein